VVVLSSLQENTSVATNANSVILIVFIGFCDF
jgi:hypothetical protein